MSQATLDVSQSTSDSDVQVVLASESENYILCTLSKKKDLLQVPLDLVFSEGDEISFSCVGGVVHLTGYLVPNDEFDGFGDGEEDVDSEQEELEVNSKPTSKSLKRMLEAAEAEARDSDEEDIDSDESGLDESGDGDDSDDDDVEEEEDGEEEEEEIEEPVAKKPKQNGTTVVNGKAPKNEKSPVAQPIKERKLNGGVIVEDIRIGKGQEAVNGRTVQVRFNYNWFRSFMY